MVVNTAVVDSRLVVVCGGGRTERRSGGLVVDAVANSRLIVDSSGGKTKRRRGGMAVRATAGVGVSGLTVVELSGG